MDRLRLRELLDKLPSVRAAVIGDFFLDRYWVIDPAFAEVSVETGLNAHQIVGKRLFPGAAGTVVSNLRALGIGTVSCLGVIGLDGEGFELKRGLDAVGADSSQLIERADRFTPCYTKPMLRENGKERELERLDIKNRSPLPADAEDELLGRLRAVLPDLDAVIIADQVQERNFGVVTDRVRTSLCELAAGHLDTVFFVDSRLRIGEYRSVIIKPNKAEAVDAVKGGARADRSGPDAHKLTLDEAKTCARALRERTGRPVFMTAQEDGMFIFDEAVTHVPAILAAGEIDPVGAGDSATAGIVSGLCAGGSLEEAAFLGNLTASVTVRKIGQTGTATPAELLAAYDEAKRRN